MSDETPDDLLKDFLRLDSPTVGEEKGLSELMDRMLDPIGLDFVFESDSFTESQLIHTYKLQKRGSQWCAVSEDGTKSLGCYPTEAEARERLRQVEAAKAVGK